MATSQAKSAIEKLRKAGLKRNQFSVRTEQRYIGTHPDNGKSMYEYGDANISLKGMTSSFLPYAESMADVGLHVEIWKFENGLTHLYVTDEYSKSGLWERDYTDTDDYGLPKTEKIK